MLSCPSLLPYNLTVLSHAPCHHYPQRTGKQTAALGRQVSSAGHLANPSWSQPQAL